MQIHFYISAMIMFTLTFSVLTLMFFRRMSDMRQGITAVTYFKTYDLETVIPKKTRQLERNYANLFETPILFYAVIGLILATGLDHLHLIVLAYAYAGLRVLHSIVHIGANKLYPRMILFWSSMFVQMLLWVKVLFLLID